MIRIFSQVGAWLKSAASSNPLRYHHDASQMEHAYGFGYSQTGGYLVNDINTVHPLVVKSAGKPIYDAYIVAVAGGAFAGAYPMNQCDGEQATAARLRAGRRLPADGSPLAWIHRWGRPCGGRWTVGLGAR